MGYRELVTALYFGDDVNIDSDTVFGVSKSLVVEAQGRSGLADPGPARGALRFPPGQGGAG